MKIKSIYLLILAPLLFSCEMGSEMNFDDHYVIDSKIYQYNISDSATSIITKGNNPIILPESNKMLYIVYEETGTKLLSYNFANGTHQELYNAFIFFDDLSISPDEKYLSFIKRDELIRLNLNSSELETLFSSKNHLIDYPPPHYSPNGKFIISLFNKTNAENGYDSDSVFINIYDVDQTNVLHLDSVILRSNDKLQTGFIYNSEKFYVSREGYHPDNHKWQIEFLIYKNKAKPFFYNTVRFLPESFASDYLIYERQKMLIFENNEILFFDLSSGVFLRKVYLDEYFTSVVISKNESRLLGITDSKIFLMNLEGEVLDAFQPNVEDNIVWADFLEEENKIIFRTEEHYY